MPGSARLRDVHDDVHGCWRAPRRTAAAHPAAKHSAAKHSAAEHPSAEDQGAACRAAAAPSDHGLVTARVGLDAAARRVEDHHDVGVIEGAPSGIAGAGEGTACR
jgi:hypothetical protein